MFSFIDTLALITTIMGVVTSFTYFVQAHTIWKNKSSKNVSLTLFTFFTVNIIFWLVYGIVLNNMPLIIVNSISLLGACTVVSLVLKYRKSRR